MSFQVCREHLDAMMVQDDHEEDLTCLECGLPIDMDVILILAGQIYKKDTKDNFCDRAAELSSTDRATAYREIGKMSDRLNQPKRLMNKTTRLFKRVYESYAVNCYSIDVIVAVCIYIVCQHDDVPISFKEICAVSKASQKEISCAFRLIIKDWERGMDTLITKISMASCCSRLGLSSNIRKAAICISSEAVEMGLAPGQEETSIEAAAIYMASQASDEKKTLKEVRDATGVSEVDIMQSYKLMLPDADELFPLDFQFCTSVQNLPTNFDEINTQRKASD